MDKGMWKTISDQHRRERVFRTVQNVSKTLVDPERARNITLDKSNSLLFNSQVIPAWFNLGLGSGYPGICLCLGELDRHFPEEGWDIVGLEYMKKVQESIEQEGIYSLDLFSGLAGIITGAYSLSRSGERYQNFIFKLQSYWIEQCQIELSEDFCKLKTGISMHDYDVITGWTGKGRYLLSFSQDPQHYQLLKEVLVYFVELSKPIQVNGVWVPGWFISSKNQATDHDKKIFANGSFNLGLSHGIPGPLALMSLAYKKGMIVPGQKEAIETIVNWLMEWRVQTEFGDVWTSQLSWEEYQAGRILQVNTRDAWCYGTPGVARTIWLAGDALENEDWKHIALESFLGIFKQPENLRHVYSPTFCHGLAGLLHLTQRMWNESGHKDLEIQRDRLVDKILSQYNEDHPFGFQDYVIKEDQISFYNKAGLIEGSAGTLLALFATIQQYEPNWDSVYLIS